MIVPMHIHPSESWETQELDAEWAKRSSEWGDLRAAMDFIGGEANASKNDLHQSIWSIHIRTWRCVLEWFDAGTRAHLIYLAVALRAYAGLTIVEVLEAVTDELEKGDFESEFHKVLPKLGQLLVKGMDPNENDLELKKATLLSATSLAVALAARGSR